MKKSCFAFLVVGLMLTSSSVRAGNDDGILLGNDAALTAGAVVGTVNDGSALWYNPAGLAQAMGSSVDVGATAFALRRYKMKGLIAVEDGDSADASFTEIVSIPSALTYVRRFSPRTVAGLGLFASQVFDYTLRASLSLPLAPADSRMQMLVTQESARYHLAGGFGTQVGRQLSFGVSLFGDYDDSVNVLQGGTTAEVGGRALLSIVQASHTQEMALGFHLRAGMVYVPTDHLRLGLSVESPAMYIYRSGRVTGLESSTAPNDAGELELEVTRLDQEFSGADFGLYLPARVRFGGSFSFNQTILSLEGDVQHKLKNREVGVDRVLNWNVRAGARVHATPTWSFGAGFFTDRGPEREDKWGAGTVDFYGGTIGGQYDSVKSLAGSGNPQEPRANLTFSSTLALRYAYGVGRLPGQYLTQPDFEAETRAVDLHVHEFTLHLGSGVYF